MLVHRLANIEPTLAGRIVYAWMDIDWKKRFALKNRYSEC